MTQLNRQTDKWIALGNHIDASGQKQLLGVPVMDLMTHGSVYGTTGSGKTTLLNNLVLQLAMQRVTTVVVTPHRGMITDPTEGILARLPRHAMKRVIYIDLASQRPPQFNIATNGLERSQAVAIENSMVALRNLDPTTWDGLSRSRRLLRQAMTALVAVKGHQASLIDLYSFMSEAAVRKRIVDALPESAMESRHYWNLFAETAAKSRDGAEYILAPARGRIDQFALDGALKHSLALPIIHPQIAIDFQKELSVPGKIFLITISKADLSESARTVFGTFLMETVIDVCMARKQHHPTVIFMDEMGDMAGVGDIERLTGKSFAETRKFQLGSLFATQFPAQLPPSLIKAAEALTNLKIVLKLEGEGDAKTALPNLASEILKPRDLLKVEKYHGYARTKVHGESQPTFYFQTLPPLDYSKQKTKSNGIPKSPQYETDLFHELETLRRKPYEDAVQYLTRLSAEEFDRLLIAQVRANHQLAEMIANERSLVPNQVSAMIQYSERRYGLDRRWYEAQYRRRRFGIKKAPSAPAVVGTPKVLKEGEGDEY